MRNKYARKRENAGLKTLLLERMTHIRKVQKKKPTKAAVVHHANKTVGVGIERLNTLYDIVAG